MFFGIFHPGSLPLCKNMRYSLCEDDFKYNYEDVIIEQAGNNMIRYDKPIIEDASRSVPKPTQEVTYPKDRDVLRQIRDEGKQELASLDFFDKLARYMELQRSFYGPQYAINVRNRQTGVAEKALNMRLDGRTLREAIPEGRDWYVEGYIPTNKGFVRDIYDPRVGTAVLRDIEGKKYIMEEKTIDAYLVARKMYSREDVELNIDREVMRNGWDKFPEYL